MSRQNQPGEASSLHSKKPTDFFYVLGVIGLIALTIAMGVFPIQTTDIFFYLALGKKYFETGHFPQTDPFIYSIVNYHWPVMHEWLSYLLAYKVFDFFGYGGLIFAKVGLYLFGILIPIALARRMGYRSPLMILLGTMAILSLCFRCVERSSAFTDVFVPLTIALVLYDHRRKKVGLNPEALQKGRSFQSIYFMPPLMAFWVNVHPGFIVAVAVMGLSLAIRMWEDRPQIPKNFLGVFAATLGATLLNPHGIYVWKFPLGFIFGQEVGLWDYILEYAPLWHPFFHGAWEVYVFFAMILIVLVLIINNRKKKPYLEAALWCLVSYLGVRANRNVPLAAISLGVIAISVAAGSRPEYKWNKPTLNTQWILSLLPLVIATFVFFNGYRTAAGLRQFGVGIDARFYPGENLRFIEMNHVPGNIFNTYDLGGYLAWVWEDRRQIFIHGFVTDVSFLKNEYFGIDESLEKFEGAVKKYNLRAFLVTRLEGETRLIKILKSSPDWQLASSDRATLLFVRRSQNLP